MLYYLIIFVLVALDQLTKFVVVSAMSLGQSIPLVGFIQFTYIQNTGMAFGLFRDADWFFSAVSVVTVLLILLVLVFWKRPLIRPYHLPLSIVIGGAVGNLIDRIFRGYVVDFIDFTYWPVFNVADIAVCAGVVLLAIQIFRDGGREQEKIKNQ